MSRRERLQQARLYLIATARGSQSVAQAEGLVRQVERAVEAGVLLVQLRLKEWSGPDALAFCRRLLAAARDGGALVIVNDDPARAARLEADGVHLGASDPPVDAARDILGSERLIGATCRDLAALRGAEAAGANYVGVGPCFASDTKPQLMPRGVERLRPVFRAASVPAYAIGGITPESLPNVLAAGASRVAVGGAMMDALDPARVATLLLSRLSRGSG